jgi:hypothetical protein
VLGAINETAMIPSFLNRTSKHQVKLDKYLRAKSLHQSNAKLVKVKKHQSMFSSHFLPAG